MSVIDTLIYDRTNADLVNRTDKAYIDYADLNRIEEACAYLAANLGVTIQTKAWEMSAFRTEAEMQRIRSNINTLRAACGNPTVSDVPARIAYTSVAQANLVERLLYDINAAYADVMSGKSRLSFTLGQKQIGNRR